MAEQIVKDFLGPPNRVAASLEYFAEPVRAARELAAVDPRALARDVGKSVKDISDKAARLNDALRAALQLLPDDSDNDEARAVLELIRASSVSLCNDIFRFAGSALVSLELGGLHDAKEKPAFQRT